MFRDPFAKPTRKRTLTAADKKNVAAKQGWKCKRCKKTLPARFHVDHIKPFAEGGSDQPSNLQALCGTCHDMKTEEDRHKKKQKKIREKENSANNIWGGTLMGSSTPRKTTSGFDIGLGPKKKSRKKKSIWEL